MIEKTLRLLADDETGRLPKNMPLTYPLRLRPYIEKVLPLELASASSDRDEPFRLPEGDKKGGVLVMLVGHSLDPLLQSVCAYGPKHILLILNKDYHEPGDKWGDFVAEWIEKLWEILPEARKKLPEPAKQWVEKLLDDLLARPLKRAEGTIEKVVLDKGDHPAAVYHKLRDALKPFLQDKEKIILDITGGKKSMVTGAFLFGARTKVPISYVDFDEYDHEKTRAPRGYTCRIGTLRNPYTHFRLVEWERVRGFYEKYAFRSASLLLNDIKLTMEDLKSEGGWFEGKDVEAVQTLIEVMQIYEWWENGDFSRAHAGYQQLTEQGCIGRKQLPMPTAVEVLGKDGYWPHGNAARGLHEQVRELEFKLEKAESEVTEAMIVSLYLDVPKLLTYIHDELKKIDRLIKYNEDWRSALLRSVGLTEVLMRARMLILLKSEKVQIAVEPVEEQSPEYRSWSESNVELDPWKIDIYERVARMESIYALIPALRYRGGKSKYVELTIVKRKQAKGEEEENRTFRLRRKHEEGTPLLDKKILWDEGKNLRNKATHFCLSVPEEMAEKARKKAEENVADLEKNWTCLIYSGQVEVCTKAVVWGRLLDACGVDFLPPTLEE